MRIWSWRGFWLFTGSWVWPHFSSTANCVLVRLLSKLVHEVVCVGSFYNELFSFRFFVFASRIILFSSFNLGLLHLECLERKHLLEMELPWLEVPETCSKWLHRKGFNRLRPKWMRLVLVSFFVMSNLFLLNRLFDPPFYKVVGIMRVNVEKVLERDQKLSELDDRAGKTCCLLQFKANCMKLHSFACT